ncbi:MAG: hypothetical protein CMO97_01615 [Woeseia sp.]|nr:hypothetical protein [Woeseia sp.]|tara:strand:- start:472 stop:762 length:291 start_codon:yes stop_codon:yes gene_type:complete
MIEWVVVVMVSLNTGGSMLMERHDVFNTHFQSKEQCIAYIEKEGEDNITEEIDSILGDHVKRMSNPFCTPKSRKNGQYPEYPEFDWQLTPYPVNIA